MSYENLRHMETNGIIKWRNKSMIYKQNFKMASKISLFNPSFIPLNTFTAISNFKFQARMILRSIILAGMPLQQTICVINVLSEGLQNKEIIKQI